MAELTPLAVAALGVLLEGPRHPYEINQILMQRRRDDVVKIRPSSLYHAIERLEKDGLITSLGCRRDGNRPERTTYIISERGRCVLSEHVSHMIETPALEFPQIDFALSEAHGLPRSQVIALIEQRITAQRARIAELEDSYRQRAKEPSMRQFLIHVDYRIRILGAEIEWLHELSQELGSGRMEWLVHEHAPSS